MKIGSFVHEGVASYGAKTDEGIIDLASRLPEYPDLLTMLQLDGLAHAEEVVKTSIPDFSENDVNYLPLIPTNANCLCAGINYLDHIEETGREKPEFPTLFYKTSQAIVGHGQAIMRPTISHQLDYEGEFALVVGKTGRNIPVENWREYVAGYTIFMDGSIRDFQKRSVDQGKNFYKSSALGPWMTTLNAAPALSEMRISTRLNGSVMQDSCIDLLCFTGADLLSYYSHIMELSPGDIIATGTPGGVGSKRNPQVWMKNGDHIEVSISGLGTLSNIIADEESF